MCVFNRPSPPPPLPEPRPTPPRPEKTAGRVVVGSQRTGPRTEGLQRGRRKQSSLRSARRIGTGSLIIPLLNQGQTGMGNLNY